MSFIEIKALSKTYHKTPVFQELSLSIEEGELVTLLGPSGCGKSTLLKCIAGLISHETGEIWMNGENITEIVPKDRGIGFMFQSYALFPNMNVYENVAFGLSVRKVDKKEIERRVKDILDVVNLNDKIKAYPSELSGGQQQRVALARSLVMQPKLMLMDEPLSALDAKIRKSLRAELRRIQKSTGMTTVFVTHDQEEALTMSDKIFVMDNGQIVQQGTSREIYEKPCSRFVAEFIGNYNILDEEDIKKMGISSKIGSKGPIAIRPEVIAVFDADGLNDTKKDGLWIKGQVEEIIMMGNMIRYIISVSGKLIQADAVNVNYMKCYNIGQNVTLFIDRCNMCELV